jgi:hypothetical protein
LIPASVAGDFENLTAIVVTTAATDVVLKLLGVAVGALDQVGGDQGVVATAHVALALAGLLLGDGVF